MAGAALDAHSPLFREALQSEEFKWLQQASMEQQLGSLRQSLQDQISAAHGLTSGLQARLDDIQKQVTQVTMLDSFFFTNSQLAGSYMHKVKAESASISVKWVSIENHNEIHLVNLRLLIT